MKEKLYTIPLNDAMNAEDECPFCFIERNVEQDIMDYVLGSCASYMESDTREAHRQSRLLPHALQENVRLRQHAGKRLDSEDPL